jgi:hypothetical protein
MEKSDELKSIKSTVDKATGLWSIDKPAGIVSSRSDFRFDLPGIPARHHRVCRNGHDAPEAEHSEDQDIAAAR